MGLYLAQGAAGAQEVKCPAHERLVPVFGGYENTVSYCETLPRSQYTAHGGCNCHTMTHLCNLFSHTAHIQQPRLKAGVLDTTLPYFRMLASALDLACKVRPQMEVCC